MRKLALALGVTLMSVLALMGQDIPKAELFTGVSYLRMEKQNELGWDANISGVINKNLGIVGDASGYYNSQTQFVNGIQRDVSGSIHSIMAGIHVSEPTGKWSPFVQPLFGWARVHTDLNLSNTQGVIVAGTNNANAFSMALGGGLDYSLNPMVGIRILQVDYMLLRSQGQKQQGARLTAGLVFRLGKKSR